MRVYVDSNVLISYMDPCQAREEGSYQEVYANEFFRRALDCEFTVVISPLVVKEVRGVLRVAPEVVFASLSELDVRGKLQLIAETEEHWRKGRMISSKEGVHLADAVHAIIAKEADATVLTWNTRDFKGAVSPATI